MSKETKIGLFTILAIVAAIWGYTFLKGQNILNRSNIFYAIYDDVDNLPVSSPVLINGLQVGIVQKLYLNEKDPSKVVVVLDIDRSVNVPKTAVALMQTTSFLGNKAITLSYRGICTSDCAVSGDTLRGDVAGLIESMLPEASLQKYFNLVRDNVGGIVDTIAGRIDLEGDVAGQSIKDIKATLANIREITDNLNILIEANLKSVQRTTNNLESISNNLEDNNEAITQIIANATKITEELSALDLKSITEQAGNSMESIDETLVSIKKAGDDLSSILNGINKGEGTLGMMIHDPSVYQNLEKTTRNLDLLLQDVRLNPKRYVNVSVFGKRQKSYELPENDPAFQDEELDIEAAEGEPENPSPNPKKGGNNKE